MDVENSQVPEWLIKLEKRREEKKAKLGHESGAGAKCNECGPSCPGLDLHFWRKVCRNCKCRKDQHECLDEDLTGIAQFEILGQVRSKPGYIQISNLAETPVKLEWIPPNVTLDLASDYLNQLGSELIPVEGSEAAAKRKQQLAFQVPAHDLNPLLCDNLTEGEKDQLSKYVDEIKENCVGQGNIIRIGHSNTNPFVGYDDINDLPPPPPPPVLQTPSQLLKKTKPLHDNRFDGFNSPLAVRNPFAMRNDSVLQQPTPIRKIRYNAQVPAAQDAYYGDGKPIEARILKDPILSQVLQSDVIKSILHEPSKPLAHNNSHLVISNVPMELESDKTYPLPAQSKNKLEGMQLNYDAVQSGVFHGDVYDRLLNELNNKKINYARCAVLEPMDNFRSEYLRDDSFKNDIDNLLHQHRGDLYNEAMNSDAYESAIIPSQSSDSGFDSIPPTPNYSTYPSELPLPPPPEELLQPYEMSDVEQALQEEFEKMNFENPTAMSMPQVSVMKCQNCKLDIWAGEVAIKADRAGKDAAWHPKCFVCFKCKELLADLVYFYHKGQVYCARDLAEMLQIPRCNACDELIFTKEYTAAENQTFHIKHFCCYNCDIPLAGQQYIPDKNQMPLCLSCYEKVYPFPCQKCQKMIGPTEQRVGWENINWHTDCFICAGVNCHKSLIGGRFCVKNQMPFCSPQCLKSLS